MNPRVVYEWTLCVSRDERSYDDDDPRRRRSFARSSFVNRLFTPQRSGLERGCPAIFFPVVSTVNDVRLTFVTSLRPSIAR